MDDVHEHSGACGYLERKKLNLDWNILFIVSNSEIPRTCRQARKEGHMGQEKGVWLGCTGKGRQLNWLYDLHNLLT